MEEKTLELYENTPMMLKDVILKNSLEEILQRAIDKFPKYMEKKTISDAIKVEPQKKKKQHHHTEYKVYDDLHKFIINVYHESKYWNENVAPVELFTHDINEFNILKNYRKSIQRQSDIFAKLTNDNQNKTTDLIIEKNKNMKNEKKKINLKFWKK